MRIHSAGEFSEVKAAAMWMHLMKVLAIGILFLLC